MSPVAKGLGRPYRLPHERREKTMQMKRIYQVQHWLYGQWIREHNWCKVEAFSEKEAAGKVCGVALTEAGKLAQLRARVLTLGDRKQTRATPFYAVELATDPASVSSQCNVRSMSVGRSIQGERSAGPRGPSATGCGLLLP
jgi:hypothetical protein